MQSTEFSIPISVEVSIAEVLKGIFEIDGLLNYSDETLTLEFQSKELFSRASHVNTVHIEIDALREIAYKNKISGSTITLRPRRLSAFSDVPLASNTELVLKTKRGDRKEAEALVSHVQRVMSYKNTPGGSDRIPFRGRDIGLREVNGDMYIEDEEFLVFEIKNAIVGEFDKEEQIIKISPRALREYRLEPRRFRDRLYIRPKSRDLLDAMPGSYSDELELKIRSKHRDQVERLMYHLSRLSKNDPSD